MTEFLSIANEYPINQDKPKENHRNKLLAAVQKSLDLLGNFERTLTKVVNAKNVDW
jgi:flagellar biosynthesis/type III secretory pathway protein FliH